jgi:hypothetical protein
MEAAHQYRDHSAHGDHSVHHGHDQDHDWSDESFVADWIERQEAHAAERRPLCGNMHGLPERLR